MNDVMKILKDYLVENRYRIVDDVDPDDENTCIAVFYEMKTMYIFHPTDDDAFFSIMYPNAYDFEEEGVERLYQKCCEFNAKQKVVRAFPLKDTEAGISYEFYCINEEDLYYQIKKGFEELARSVRHFRRLTWH